MKKIILITGATSGFGKAMAYEFAKNGHNIIITGRRLERLEYIKEDIEQLFHVDVLKLHFDIRDKDITTNIISQLESKWKQIDILINNAGLARGIDTIENGNTNDWDEMIDTNLKGLLYISKEVINLMIKNKKGHIINIGSTAGKETYFKGNVYCATKSAVDAITKSMRIDLLPHNIKVSQICPGAANTEFSTVRLHGNKDKADNIYDGYKPLYAQDIANITYYITTLPRHVCINDLVVTCSSQANSFYINKKNDNYDT